MGTDENPLHLDFLLNGLNSNKIYWANGYVELTLGTDRANTHYFPSQDCSTYCDPAGSVTNEPMPIICAQGNPSGVMPAGCPDVQAYPPPVRASIAVGVLGMLDTDPCHCEDDIPQHGPKNKQLNVFDGQKWWRLTAGNPQPTTGIYEPKDGAPMPPPHPEDLTTPGNFTMHGGYPGDKAHNWISLTIKTNTFKVEMRTVEKDTAEPPNQYYVTSVMDNIPRAYKYTGPEPTDFSGAFDSMRIGTGMGCELASNTSWTGCSGNTHPLRSRACCDQNGNSMGGANVYDDLVLYGGAGAARLGACCLDDGGCIIASAEECSSQHSGFYRGADTICDASTCLGACCDGFDCTDTLIPACSGDYQGVGTACATTNCPCHTPSADVDFDGDVDQDDFSGFQACMTGTGPATVVGMCRCFDRENGGQGDADVDADDYDAFEACASGPDVPADPACE